MDLGLKDRVALVAAASQGLGRAVALGLAREGAKVAICARGEEALQATAAEIPTECLAMAIDVRVEAQVKTFVQATEQRFGRIDICVANAGGPPARTFEATSLEDWRAAVDLNLLSTVMLAKEVLPGMKERRWGRFLTISSVAARQPIDSLILSNGVRPAVIGLVKSLSNEYGPYNVLVNNIAPGFTATERLKKLDSHPEASIPLRRIGEPEEFANLVVFLASERASYITGQTMLVDGGFAKGT